MPTHNHWFAFTKRAGVVALLLATFGCANLDPQNVGNGHYMQIFQGKKVVAEIDTSNAGMLNCPNQAYQHMQADPSLVGRVKCSSVPSEDALPYSFRAHRQFTLSDGFKPPSPYLTRISTSQACASWRQAVSGMEKTVIVDDNCNAEVATPSQQLSQQLVTPSQSSTSPAVTDRLRLLEKLRTEKLITEEEFRARRQIILNLL